MAKLYIPAEVGSVAGIKEYRKRNGRGTQRCRQPVMWLIHSTMNSSKILVNLRWEQWLAYLRHSFVCSVTEARLEKSQGNQKCQHSIPSLKLLRLLVSINDLALDPICSR